MAFVTNEINISHMILHVTILKMAAPTERVCGWIDRQEFQNVYECLYSRDLEQQEHALHKIALWKCRVQQKLSTSIECTAQLVLATVEDKKRQTQTEHCGDPVLRLNHAMALVRFINLITEKNQNKMFAKPVHHLAEELGVPEWIVDLRHEATHGNMPTLAIMRTATDFALNWLKEEYWESMFDAGDSGDADALAMDEKVANMKKELRSHLDHFMEIQFKNYKKTDESEESSNAYKKSLKAVLYNIKPLLLKYRFEAFSVVVSPGVFYLSYNQLEDLKEGLSQEILTASDVVLPKVVVRLLKPLLKMIHAINLTPVLLQTLMSKFTENKRLSDCLVVGWAATILTSLLSLECSDVAHCGVNLYEEGCALNAEVLLHSALVAPSSLTIKLLPWLFRLQNPPLPNEKQQQLLNLVEVYASPVNCIVIDGQLQDSSDEDVKSLSDMLQATLKDDSDYIPWKISTECVNWASLPLGSVPNAPTRLNLDLPKVVNFAQAGLGSPELPHRLTENLEGIRKEECRMDISQDEICLL
ncbi:hypothetical protein CAPTEDRAFT_226006 [Capitella teleta]|uniref:Ribosomal biogenesis protein LAS1L n=1 Tax=Capitella teleta TaxID=283909 RepID=R7VG47_CAPTE|nr:hypothetical protein CAPTEDRAFT_226006 [Capitella teleta]|eukprot:ELU17594.1 hypothetical protein CAPTEDRAFT_226006 [Capitella teleta]